MMLIAGSTAIATYTVGRVRQSREPTLLWSELPADTAMPQELTGGQETSAGQLQEALIEAGVDHDVAGHDIAETAEAAAGMALETRTVGELYELAKQYEIPGRSSMRKAELITALQAMDITENSR